MGQIEINHTGSGGTVVLSSDGTDLLLGGSAVGGGADLYAANESSPSAQPSATGANAVAIGEAAVASGVDAVSIGDNSVASGLRSISLGGFTDATADYAAAIGAGAQAIGTKSVAIYGEARHERTAAIGQGSNSNVAIAGITTTNSGGAVAIGGAFAGGVDSFAAAIANNTSSYGATGANSVAIGYRAKATGQNGTAIGGTTNTASGSFSFAAGPSSNVASGIFSVAIGDTCQATTNNAFALGHDGKSVIQGKFAYGSGKFTTVSDAQNGMFVLRRATTDATATQLTTNNGGAATTNQVILPNNSAYSFSGTIIAREQASAGSDYASWEIKGALLRDANAASTVLGNGIQNKMYATSGASAWAIALTADTTNGGLKIEVTGAASTNIRWVATVSTSEVTY